MEKPSTAKLALKWGAITGVALMLFSTGLYLTSATPNQFIGLLLYVIFAVGLVLSMREFKRENTNYLSYGEGLGLGLQTGAVAALISTMYSVLYTSVIDPTMMERVINEMRDKLEDQGNLSDDQIEQSLSIMQAMQGPGIQFITGILWLVFIGFVFSLVIAAVLRRNKPVFE